MTPLRPSRLHAPGNDAMSLATAMVQSFRRDSKSHAHVPSVPEDLFTQVMSNSHSRAAYAAALIIEAAKQRVEPESLDPDFPKLRDGALKSTQETAVFIATLDSFGPGELYERHVYDPAGMTYAEIRNGLLESSRGRRLFAEYFEQANGYPPRAVDLVPIAREGGMEF